MALSIIISSVNYNGVVGNITFYPSTGGTISLGSQTIPYTYVSDYPYGTYSIYFPTFNKTCSSTKNPPYAKPRPWIWNQYDYTQAEYVTIFSEPTGTYNSRNYYNVRNSTYTTTQSVVWYDTPSTLWTQSSSLGGGTTYATLNSIDPLEPVSSLTNSWSNVGNPPISIYASEPIGTIVTDGLILWLDAGSPLSWPGSGTNWNDITDNNNDGVFYSNLVPAAPTFLPDKMGGFGFYGNEKVRIPNSPSLSAITNEVSVEVWIKPTLLNDLEIFSKNSNQGYRMRLDSGGHLWMLGSKPTLLADIYTSTGSTSVNQWVHLVAVWTSTGYYTYINGVNAGYDLTKTFLVQQNNLQLDIGCFTGDASDFLGTQSIFRLYNRALTPSEVLSNYNTESSRFFNVFGI